jgi:replicative DNA helicase
MDNENQNEKNISNLSKNAKTFKNNKKNDGFSNGLGKVPPQARALEEAVLGALLIDKDAVAVVIDILQSDSFYEDRHKLIYKAICLLFEKSNPVDLLTVTEELKKLGELETIGGAYYLVELTNRIASAANVEFHARIIAQKFIQRELIRVSTDTINEAFEDTTDVFDLLDKAEQGLFSITEKTMSRGVMQMGSLLNQAIKQIEELSLKEDGLTGVPSGFTNLDRITSGWQPSDLIIMAARPGMGKTSLTLAIACNAAITFGKPCAFFSLEMSNLQLVNRILSMETLISSEKLRKGKLEEYEWQQLHNQINKLANVPIYIDDTPGISVFELRAKCRRLKMQHDIQIIIIDYLQLMTAGGESGKSGNREQEISQISRSLKGLAKELNVPVIALSQLSRAVEVRGGSKRPQLSDLRESGAIEQDADIVGFIYRPEYYGILEDEEGNSLKGIGEVIIAKHRNGALDTVQLKWDGQFAKFSNLDDSFIGDGSYFDAGQFDSGQTLSSKINNDTPPNSINYSDDVPF